METEKRDNLGTKGADNILSALKLSEVEAEITLVI